MVGLREYGTYENGASVYKDKKGFYIVDYNGKNEYKKYLKHWKPVKGKEKEQLCLVGKRWTLCKKNKKKNKNKTRKVKQ